ncbi:MAG: ZIP family metal transporter [Ferruginibacter sp.]|nr:ZIP family metal transporter [Cytophagales bacterium]
MFVVHSTTPFLETWVHSLLGSLAVCLVALVGSFVLFVKPVTLEKSLPLLMSLSVGVLLGNAFLHLLPGAIRQTGDTQRVMLLTLAGMLLFFFLEKAVRWKHVHQVYSLNPRRELTPSATSPKPIAQMNLLGDAVHNFIDGTLIAGSFLVNPIAGWLTTLAIIVHELPREISDVGALVYGGYSPRRAVWYNFLCSLSCLAGAVFLLSTGQWLDYDPIHTLPIAAGGFIYIAACGLIPELHKRTDANPSGLRQQLAQGLFISLGVSSMLLIIVFEKLVNT